MLDSRGGGGGGGRGGQAPTPGGLDHNPAACMNAHAHLWHRWVISWHQPSDHTMAP